MGFGSIIQEKREEMLNLAKKHGAVSLRVFGSFARGEEQANSDIDLLVELEPGRSLLDLVAIKQGIEDLSRRKVDIVTEAALSPYIREEILRQAVFL